MKNIKSLGQYFTPENIARFMINLSTKEVDSRILEPACGKGVFIRLLLDAGYKNIIGYEVDKELIGNYSDYVVYRSFVSAEIDGNFDLIIGNPPYVRWKNLSHEQKGELNSSPLWNLYFNSLCDYLYIFILKSIELLNIGGELIFITPDYWISTTHAQSLRDYMVTSGYFTHIINFVETPIFKNVASSVIIFRYVKGKNNSNTSIKIVKFNSQRKLPQTILDKILYEEKDQNIETFYKKQFTRGEQWLLAPEDVINRLNSYESRCIRIEGNHELFQEYRPVVTLGDIADIGNGMVSGLDQAFKIPHSMDLSENENSYVIRVVKAKHLEKFLHNGVERYFFLNGIVESEEELRSKYPNFYLLLQPYKDRLNLRYNYNKLINYWEWVFPRSYSLFRKPQSRIFVPCKERISHKKYIRFAYAENGLFPTQDVTAILLKPTTFESVYYLLAILNTDIVFDWIRYKGIIKGNIIEFSEKPLSSIPIRVINRDDPDEVNLHNEISKLCQNYVDGGDNKDLYALNERINFLIK